MKLNITLVSFLFIIFGFSQNEAYRCVKTTWGNSATVQIDSYNANDQSMGFIKIEENGDTSQWHINSYNAQGLIESSSILIDRYNTQYERINFQYDTLGRLLYKEIIGYHDIDTVWEDNSIQYDTHGNRLNYPKLQYPEIDSISYEYNHEGLLLSTTYFNDLSEVISQIIYEYNTAGNLIKKSNFSKGNLMRETKMYYDRKGQRNRMLVTANDGKVIRWEKYKYDKSGYIARVKCFDHFTTEPVTIVYEPISCG